MSDPIAEFDFTCLPCAGIECFRLPVAERKACAARQQPCTAGKYLCRCCDGCRSACKTLDQALAASMTKTAEQFTDAATLGEEPK